MVTLVGVRVLRGPDWEDGDEDGGEGHLGTIRQLLSNHKVSVVWDNGNESTYRAGTDGKFDLRIFDTAQAGVQHPNHTCAECGDVNFYGTMWTCNECSGIDLCTLCYYNDKHDLRHRFVRVDVSGDAGQLMNKRKASIKIRSAGMFPGAKVKRGKDWMWGDQDGGQGSEGEVVGFESVAPDSSRNILRVKWPNGASNSYRIGYAGHVDILCLEEEPGLFYYRDHLPVVDTTLFQQTTSKTEKSTPESSTASSDSSVLSSDVRERRERSDNSSDKMSSDKQSKSAATIGSLSGESRKEFKDTYTLSSVGHTTASPDSETEITYIEKAYLSFSPFSTKLMESPQEIKISSFEPSKDPFEGKTTEDENEELSVVIGDYVSIQVGEDKLKELQPNYSGYVPAMLCLLGRYGKVKSFSRRLGVVAQFRRGVFRFNPAALIKVPNLTEGDIVRIRRDIEKVKILCERVTWIDIMKETLGKVGRVVEVSDEEVRVSFGSLSFRYNAACCLPAPGATPVKDLREHIEAKNRYRVVRIAVGSDIHSDSAILYAAIHHGNDDVVRAICEADRSLIERHHQEITPLILACFEDQRRVAEVLLEMGADVNHYVDNKTPINASLEGKSEVLTKLLLERGADPFRMDWRSNGTYIHIATGFDLPGAIRTLAEVGVDVNAKDDNQDTAMHLAISQNNMKAMEALVSLESIDFKVQNKRHFEVLHHACITGSARSVELILARDKSRVDEYIGGKSAPLHVAAFNDHFECVRLLVTEGGATIDLPDLPLIHTPLHLACQRANFLTAEALLELGADVNVQNTQGSTPLHLAMGCRVIINHKSEEGEHENQIRVGIACMLISKGAYCDVKDEDGRVPLVFGCSSMTEAVKKFVASNPHLVKLTTGIASEMTATGTASTFQKKENCDVTEALKGMGLPCGVCFALKSDVTLQPCQHKCVCSKCSEKVTQCPLCDAKVENKDITGEDDQNIDVEKFCKDVGVL